MIDGALLLDKPLGLSSNAALQKAKRIFGAKKAGHAGTLDPLASGLLLVLFGEATKFAGPLLEDEKEYRARLKLGEKTSTADAEGDILETREVAVSRGEVDAALARFRGEIEQVPPMHSALKRDGVPLYQLARKGQTVERAPRRVRILELECVEFTPPFLDLRVRCTKGTYVRTLAEDIGDALGTGAHLAALRRTGSGGFRLRHLLPLDSLLAGITRAELDPQQEARFRQGQALKPFSGEGLRAVYGADGRLVGLGQAELGGVLRPVRLLASQETDKHPKTL
jgi:tRNA pseudouridine55 synthase